MFKKLSTFSGATLLSRVLGLVRDILFFSVFGASVFGEAFLLAFTFPNLFRRMLGEGTLTSALIPIYTSCLEKTDQRHAYVLLNQVFTRLVFFLGFLVLLICGISLVCFFLEIFSDSKWGLAMVYNSITFGYVILICSSAILVGVLNVHGFFFEGAISPVILNLCMLGALILSFSEITCTQHTFALYLCGSVLLAGALQLWLPWSKLVKVTSWRWVPTMEKSQEFISLSKLFWVGALGAAVTQVNVLVSRFLAFSLDEEGSLSFLYISARLVELPLGLFAVAVSTVIFPLLSKASVKKNNAEFEEYFFKGVRLIAAITIPAAVGLSLLAEPILMLIFKWNEFSHSNVMKAASVLQVAAFTIPIYALSQFLVKAHHSQKNMKVPLYAAIFSLISNAFLSVVFMNLYGVVGLAWANLLSAVCQSCFLIKNISFLRLKSCFSREKLALHIILMGSLAVLFVVQSSHSFFDFNTGKLFVLLTLSLIILVSVFLYLLLLFVMKFPESRELLGKSSNHFSQ